ncbi:CrcB family protein [Phyllobacterium leguminum]|uniref:Fluoride-specific ion channel FluC n=1 Tax=Phyllobacterium leguminum TaxID=314237 RepID=A0A318T5T9_9HYPH|nr:CrcB family protein [Phyllobacterium leguminum]PYE90449.1 camphor resistance protein CrcB [Phyllobacterium leguminum]
MKKRSSKTVVLYLAVGFGAGLGALLRFWCGLAVAGLVESGLWTTAFVNISGSFAIVFFAAIVGPDGRWPVGSVGRQFVMGGVCGGFTTFSAMSLDTLLLILRGEPLRAIFYLLTVVILSLAAGWMGHLLARATQD